MNCKMKTKTAIYVQCPVCKVVKKVKVPLNIYESEKGALFHMEVPEGVVCNHKFTAILDVSLSIRDYLVPKQIKPMSYHKSTGVTSDLSNI